jgi:hypothetical protein
MKKRCDAIKTQDDSWTAMTTAAANMEKIIKEEIEVRGRAPSC